MAPVVPAVEAPIALVKLGHNGFSDVRGCDVLAICPRTDLTIMLIYYDIAQGGRASLLLL